MTQAALTGALVSTGIALAGATAWLVTDAAAPANLDRVTFGALAPVDADRLRAEADPLAVEQGRIYYVQICASCHGARADGRGEWAWRVTPRPADLTAVRTRRRSDAELFDIVSEPQPGTPMIGWKRQLSENQRRQLIAYLRQLGAGGAAEVRH